MYTNLLTVTYNLEDKMSSPDRNNDQNINIYRENRFSSLHESKEKKPILCRFFIKNMCSKGDKCEYSHNLRDTMVPPVEMTEDESLSHEVTRAIETGNLNSVFEKMLGSPEDYKKYYSKVNMRFRGVAVMKLKKQSIINKVVDTISLRNVKINGEILKYGYMPILFHFIMNGFAWNTFQGATNDAEYIELCSCFSDLVEQLQKVKVKDHQIPKYNDQEYDGMLIEACEYVDPSSYENSIHVSSHYLCDIIVVHIKETFRSSKHRKLLKLHGEYGLVKLKESMTEDQYKNLLYEDFNIILNETDQHNKKAYDVFLERKENKEEAIKKYKEKCDKVIRCTKLKSMADEARQRLAYNLEQLDKKINLFYNDIFNTQLVRKKYVIIDINYEAKFNDLLSKLHGFKTRFGTRCEINALNPLLHLVNTEFKSKRDEYVKRIIDNIPLELMNPKDVIQTFTDMNNIDYLWTSLLTTISIDKPTSASLDLLSQFFKEQHIGLRESYICQYLEKLSKLAETLSTEQKDVFVEIIMKSLLSDNIKKLIAF